MSRFTKVVRAEFRTEDRRVALKRRFGDPVDAPKRVAVKPDHSQDPLYIREKKKWEDLGIPELLTRLRRMKNPKKLQMFIVLAQEHNHLILYVEAIEKVIELKYNWLIPRTSNISKMLDVKEPGRGRIKAPQIRKVRVEKVNGV